MSKSKKQSVWQNRIVGHGEKPASEFNLNPLNWRKHPDAQRAALREILAKIGWVTGVIENVTTGNLIDGHARVGEAIEAAPSTVIPFTQVKISESEEKEILLLLDPIGSMATADEEILRSLLEIVGIESEKLLAALDSIEGIDLSSVIPESPNLNDPSFNYQSQYGVIVICDDEDHQKRVFDDLSAAGHKVKVVVV